ncbi:MAG: hypothetical protein Q4A13_03710, partial [Fretibacterium sp.]|nr:hypothetical protein [Fretibacterium sp.]
MDRLGRDIEERMIAAGRPVEEAKAMGLLASEFAGRFAERTNTRPEDALNVQFKRSKWDETKGGEGFDQSTSRQSPDYDSSDPKTWPPSAERDEAIQLDAWTSFEPDGFIEDWPESTEKTEALALQKESDEIEAWIDSFPNEEILRRIYNDDPELNEKYSRVDEIDRHIKKLSRVLEKKKPKGAQRRLTQLIDAEEAAAARELGEEYYQKKRKQSKTAPNARTYFLPDGTSVIEFFETANKSTSFHEFGHHIFNKMLEFSGKEGVDPQMAEDVETILKAAGVTREAFDADKKNARRRAHEFFARGFEKYLGEGKAPTKALRDVFRRIHNWMIEVYHKIANIPGKQLSDEMRGVYDRLFASDGAFGDIYGAEDVRSGEKIPDGMVRTERKSGITVDKKARDTSNDTRMMDLFNSPNVVARRHAKFRPFFSLGKEAVEKQEKMRANWNRAVDAIYGRKGRGGLLKKDQVSLFNETLLAGDALGKVFTSEELQERGFTPEMEKAYRRVRDLYDNAHRLLSAQRNKYHKGDIAYR